MSRVVLVAGVVGFVLLDVVLVVLAVRSVDGNAGATSIPHGSESTPSQPQTPTATAPPADTVVPRGEPLRLDGATDGTVLRATSGACGGHAAWIAVSRDGGDTFQRRETNARVVLRVDVTSLSDMWMVGLDGDCKPTFYRSGDGGHSWEDNPGTLGAWHQLTTDAAALHGPDGRVHTPCIPVAMTAVNFAFAAAGCEDGDIVTSNNRGGRWRTRGSARGVVDLAFVDRRRGFALSVVTDCPAQVSGTTNGGGDWTVLSCVDMARPGRAIALLGGDLLVQTGRDQVHRSEDDGDSWQGL